MSTRELDDYLDAPGPTMHLTGRKADAGKVEKAPVPNARAQVGERGRDRAAGVPGLRAVRPVGQEPDDPPLTVNCAVRGCLGIAHCWAAGTLMLCDAHATAWAASGERRAASAAMAEWRRRVEAELANGRRP